MPSGHSWSTMQCVMNCSYPHVCSTGICLRRKWEVWSTGRIKWWQLSVLTDAHSILKQYVRQLTHALWSISIVHTHKIGVTLKILTALRYCTPTISIIAARRIFVVSAMPGFFMSSMVPGFCTCHCQCNKNALKCESKDRIERLLDLSFRG